MFLPQKFHGVTAVAIFFVLPFALRGDPPGPAWWTARGVLNGGTADNYAAVNQGQVKTIATQGYNEITAKVPGGAGTALASVINAWATPTGATQDYSVVNLGELKTIVALFYNRLAQVGVEVAYPWSGTPDDYSLANIGQVKTAFSFDLTGYSWTGGTIPEWWAQNLFGTAAANVNPNADYTGSGLTNLQKYQQGINPLPRNLLTPLSTDTTGAVVNLVLFTPLE